MKQLQNNFTTPEQSKRLLKLGVPADSADCYWHPKERRNNKSRGYWSRPIILYDGHTVGYEQSYSAYYDLLPCWSVGRLMEIITICCNHYSGNNDIIFNQDAVNHGIIECLVAYLAIKKKDVSVDFSKLEE